MSDSKLNWRSGVYAAAMLLTAACGAPQQRNAPAANSPVALHAGATPGPVEVQVRSALPGARDGVPALLASNLSVGRGNAPVRYRADYSILPGDVITAIGTDISRAPTDLGRQRVRQEVTMHSPKIGSSPVSLGVSTETTRLWRTNGYRATQRERAELKWASSLAELKVQWNGTGERIDRSLALDCDVHGVMRVPVAGGSSDGRSQSVSLSARGCSVTAAPAAWGPVAAQHWGVAYAWQQAAHDNQLRLSVIETSALPGDYAPDAATGYELGLVHSHKQGSWRADAQVALRQMATAAVSNMQVQPQPLEYEVHDGTAWTTNTSLAHELRRMSIAATWSHGADPSWFLPDGSRRTDRFGVAVDLSGWASHWLPELSPRLGMEWKRSEVYLTPRESLTTNNELALRMSVSW